MIQAPRTGNSVLAFLLLILLLAPAASAQSEPTQQPDPDPSTEAAAQAEVDADVDPGPPVADLSPVNELILEGSYDEADTLLAELEQEFPDDAALQLMRGEVLLALGKAGEARPHLERSAELDPDRERTHFQLGAVLASEGEREAAIEAFGAELELTEDPKILTMAHLNRSMLFAQGKQWAEAAGELEGVLILDPGHGQVYGDLAGFYLRAGDTENAAKALQRGREAGFNSASHYYSLGARLYRDEKYAEAAEAFRLSLEIDAKMARAERSMAAALEKMGRDEEALEHLKRYLELAPDAEDAEQVAEKLRTLEQG